MKKSYEITSVRERPESWQYWFASKWGIPKAVYVASMRDPQRPEPVPSGTPRRRRGEYS